MKWKSKSMHYFPDNIEMSGELHILTVLPLWEESKIQLCLRLCWFRHVGKEKNGKIPLKNRTRSPGTLLAEGRAQLSRDIIGLRIPAILLEDLLCVACL